MKHRHHLIAALAMGIAAPLRWVPFIATCERTVLDLLEIDADTGALRTSRTSALVSALVKLQDAEDRRVTRRPVPLRWKRSRARNKGPALREPCSSWGRQAGSPREGSPERGGSRRGDGPQCPGGVPRGPAPVPPAVAECEGLAALIAPVSAAGVGVHAAGAVALLSGCAVL